MKKLAIGHHIGERGHIKEKEQNVYSGQCEENEEYINLDEGKIQDTNSFHHVVHNFHNTNDSLFAEEAEQFNREWQQKAQQYRPRTSHQAVGYRHANHPNTNEYLALPPAPRY